MKIYSMTATFGKLEHQTLTLKPGLNVIEAPNEWGKSTWGAFIVAMLYGIDTRERSKQGTLPLKERYAPWSGSPMSGRMEISWEGRDITIERSTKGRTVFGEFRAYETASGLPVSELTAGNCGEKVLGVERSVFVRAGFVRLTDMPVSDDDALRRRLNALVTTGDESGAADDLEAKLRALKNRCRHNKTGLLPQAELRRDELQEKLRMLKQLQQQQQQMTSRRAHLEQHLAAMENHKAALEYAASCKNHEKLTAAKAALSGAKRQYEDQLARCASLADRETVQQQILHLEQLQLQQEALLEQAMPLPPEKPESPQCFVGLTPQQALAQAEKDKAAYAAQRRKKNPWQFLLLAVLALGAAALFIVDWKLALTPAVLAIVLAVVGLRNKAKQKEEIERLVSRYSEDDPEKWIAAANGWISTWECYETAVAEWKKKRDAYAAGKDSLADNIENVTGGLPLKDALDGWRDALAMHMALDSAYQNYTQAEAYAETVAAMLKTVPQPVMEDELTFTEQETVQYLEETREELRKLQLLEGQISGRMESLGEPVLLQQALEKEQRRIEKLEEIYEAACLAMNTLNEAANQLQRKFAPRIASRAQQLFSQMTGGRYARLLLGEDMTLSVRTEDEATMRPGIWRSDGTLDQLYLALRLAVAEALTPNAPLVLDDALVRFDEKRLALAMEILKAQSDCRQVILFTCQGRERNYFPDV